MQNISTTVFREVRETTRTAAPQSGKRTTKIALAFGCLVAGFATPLAGLTFLVLHEMFNDELLNRIGTVLMIVSIPLILAGSVLMDSVDGVRE
ncbi:MAG TPA: hypothetical protein VL325_03800 [Pyrinomonadaceae bacterium]|nr:hypothetical protein [Pyrinomonadaceae bacterium]